MSRLEELIKQLPPELEAQVEDYIEFVLAKRGGKDAAIQRMRGVLADLREKYTSVELQHEISRWRADHALARHEHPAGTSPESTKGE